MTRNDVVFAQLKFFQILNYRNLEIRVLHENSLRADPFSAVYDPWRGSKLQKNVFVLDLGDQSRNPPFSIVEYAKLSPANSEHFNGLYYM